MCTHRGLLLVFSSDGAAPLTMYLAHPPLELQSPDWLSPACLGMASPRLASSPRTDLRMEHSPKVPSFPSPYISPLSPSLAFPDAEMPGSEGYGAEDDSGVVNADLHPIGGFVLPQHEEIHVVEREALQPSEPRMSMPSPTTSSVTAVSPTPTPPPAEPINIVFPPTVPHIHPRTNRATPRCVKESNPFDAPRKGRQFNILSRNDPYTIPPLNTSNFPYLLSPPSEPQMNPRKHGWRNTLHPDGSLYFHGIFTLPGRTDESLRVFTESCLYGRDSYTETTKCARYFANLLVAIPSKRIKIDNIDLVINVEMGEDYDEFVWSYYLIDHACRVPFWLRPYNPSVAMRTTERLGVSSPAHLRHLLHAMYWEHRSLYPGHELGARPFPDDAHATLVANLTWCASVSVITPLRYTAPWTAEEAVKLREQVDYLRQIKESPEHYIEVAGRTMGMLERWRYDFLHGTQVIRRFRGQTVLPEREQTRLYKTLLPLLFYAPLAHLYDFNSVYLDGVLANEPEWTRHVKKILAEWQEFVLYATILLNANLAFLSVPNTILLPDGDSSGASDSFQHALVSPAAILSYCSMLSSIGSVIIGLLLIRQHRGEEIMDNPRTDKDTFMEKRRYKHSGFELVSIQYSLPYALLMWSIILFLSALIVFTQLGTDRYTRGTALAMLAIVVVFATWCIQLGWGTSQNRRFFGKVKDPWAPTAMQRMTTRAKTSLKAIQTLPRSVFGRSASAVSTKESVLQEHECVEEKAEIV